MPIVLNLCYAIAGVVAIIGAICVYIAMNNHVFSCLQSHSDLVECGFSGMEGNIVYSPKYYAKLYQLCGEIKLLARLQGACWGFIGQLVIIQHHLEDLVGEVFGEQEEGMGVCLVKIRSDLVRLVVGKIQASCDF